MQKLSTGCNEQNNMNKKNTTPCKYFHTLGSAEQLFQPGT